MGIFYLLIAYPRFCDRISFIFEHLFVLTFWILTTGLLMMASREVIIRLHSHLIAIPGIVVPTFSYTLLFIIYVCSMLGNFYWDATPNYLQILGFVPNLFELADNFDIPRGLIVVWLALPILTLGSIFATRLRETIIWHWITKESFTLLNPRRKKWVVVIGGSSWLLSLAFLISANPSIDKFGNFSHDPIINFFAANKSFFPMTRERVYWARKDSKAVYWVRAKPPRVHNVFLFVADALRADHLPLYGYPRPLTPHFSKFLSKTHYQKVDLALANGLETITGLQCLLTSKRPWATSQFNYTLPDYLSDEGFKTNLILAGGHGWQLAHKSFGDKVDLFYDGTEHPGAHGMCDDDLTINEIAQLKPDDGTYHFFYIHLISVHQLAFLEEKFLQYKPAKNLLNLVFTGGQDPDELLATKNMYDNRILQMDDKLGKILGLFSQKGYLKDYLAVFTADHGQLLGEKGQYGHGMFSSMGALRIPMVFFSSKPIPHLLESHFGVQIDIAPTLTDMAGMDFPPTWQGQSLLRKRTNPWSYHLSCVERAGQEWAVVLEEPGHILKFSRPHDKSSNYEGDLYDIGLDPQETKNLIHQVPVSLLGEIRAHANEHLSNYN